MSSEMSKVAMMSPERRSFKRRFFRLSLPHTLRKRRGFTLIELMISLVILGVLINLSLPHFEDYLERARLTELVTQIDQVRVAFSTAAEQGDERVYSLPRGFSLSATPLPPLALELGISAQMTYPGLKFYVQTTTGKISHFPAGKRRAFLQIIGNRTPEARRSLNNLNQILPYSISGSAVQGIIVVVLMVEEN